MTSRGMPATPAALRRRRGRARVVWTTLRAVLDRELRGRMRGRRAFVVATVFVGLLGLISLGLYHLLYEGAIVEARWRLGPLPIDALPADVISGPASVRIGQALFGGLLGVLTVLTLMVAPALTSGAISSERERQTLELLVTTPISTLGMLTAKLVGSLAYVLLLIVASMPLMGIVFAFGGIAPEDVARAYVMVLAIAFGMGALGLFLSSLIGRTQIATVASYIVVLVLTIGMFALHTWLWAASARGEPEGAVRDRHAPEVLLWLNPIVADADILCTAIPDAGLCAYTNLVMGLPEDAPNLPRDALWPRVAIAFVVTGSVLTLMATQLISPSRRLRLRRPPPASSDSDPLGRHASPS